MLEEFTGDVLVYMIVFRELQGDAHEVQCIHGHPAGAVGLVDVAAGGQLRAAVEYSDVVQAQKSALEDIAALVVLAVDPPREVQHELVKHALEEFQVAFAGILLAVYLIHAPGRPGMHRRIHVAEGPFVRGNLAVGVHVPFAREQHQLVLGERGIHQRERYAVKRQIPGGIPGVFPFVGHREDVGIVQIAPIGVAAALVRVGRPRLTGIAFEPARYIEAVELLVPDESGERLTLHRARVRRVHVLLQVRIVGIRLVLP